MSRAGISGGQQLVQEKGCVKIHVVQNGGRNDGRQGIDGLCVVKKTNAWKTVRCGSVGEEKWRNVRPFFGGTSDEIGGWIQECREDGGCEKCVDGE